MEGRSFTHPRRAVSQCANGGVGWATPPSIFDNSRKNKGQPLFVNFALRVYNSYNHTDDPGLHMWPQDQFRHSFQAFARHHLKLLCCSIPI